MGNFDRFSGLLLLIGVTLPGRTESFVLGQTSSAKPPAMSFNGVHVLGLENIKRGARCKLTAQNGMIRLEAGAEMAEVSIASIRDVFTGQDSKRLIGGTLGTVSTIAVPYGGGRIISLFREKTDVLTLEYLDTDGGLHGAILTFPRGQAAEVKKQLVAQGARASIPLDDETKQQKSQEERKP